jgi:hypothetical protein
VNRSTIHALLDDLVANAPAYDPDTPVAEGDLLRQPGYPGAAYCRDCGADSAQECFCALYA